jgi:hypothetical protein
MPLTAAPNLSTVRFSIPHQGAFMGMVDKLKAKARADRMTDPHGWAYEIEKLANQRSLTGAVALFLSFALAANAWFAWRENDRLSDRIASLEEVRANEVEEAREVSEEIDVLVRKYAPQ